MNNIISDTINGIQYIITNKEDCIQYELSRGKQYNNDIFQILKNYIEYYRLRHLVNVGCHIGTLSLPLSMFLSKVTSIEAYQPTYDHLCTNIRHNNITNIVPINIALGNTKEDVYFMGMNIICPVERINRLKNNTGGMHVFTQDDILLDKRSSRNADITGIIGKMDKFDNLDIDNFDIMLVDIEGCEYEFLLGAKTKIKKNKPFIIIEIWDNNKRIRENMDTTREQVINLILDYGYKLVGNLQDDFIFNPI
jgi:FkbM family methyltransferase